MLTREEFVAWKNEETTKKVFALLKEEKEEIKEQWALGNFSQDVGLDLRHVGVIEGINKVLFMEVEDGE